MFTVASCLAVSLKTFHNDGNFSLRIRPFAMPLLENSVYKEHNLTSSYEPMIFSQKFFIAFLSRCSIPSLWIQRNLVLCVCILNNFMRVLIFSKCGLGNPPPPFLKVGEDGIGNSDFKLIASHGCRATTDLPMALYYEQILKNIFTASLFYQQETILKFGSAPGIYSQKPSLSPL